MVPRIQFVADPKFSLPLPPPKEEAPTESREKPIAVTTLAATIGSPDPIFHNGKSWISVPIPAMIIALWISMALWAEESPLAPATIRIGQNTIVFCNCNNFKQILPCSAIQILGVVHYNEIRTKKDKYKGCFICNMDILIMKKENMSLTA